MAAVPFSDGVQRLSGADHALRRRTLLKAATELFVSVPSHAAADVHMYEELALQLLRITPFEDRRIVADLLSRHPDAPAAVLAALLADDPAIASVVIRQATSIPEVELIALIATGSPEHLAALAGRPNPSPRLVEALVRKLPIDALGGLLENPTLVLPTAVTPLLVARAKGHPALACAIGHRVGDVEDADLVDLFLDLDAHGRRRVLLALELLALRDFAAGRALPKLPPPDPGLVEELARSALSRRLEVIAGRLGRLLGVEDAIAHRLLVDEGGEPLATALKASGLDEPTAMRVLVFSGAGDGRDYFQVKRLLEIFENTSRRSADFLLSRWRPEPPPLPQRKPRHRPQAESGTPLRSIERKPSAQPLRPAARKARDSA